jgi:hypothetical protein
MPNKLITLVCVCAVLAGCAIPGFGPYASDEVDKFIGLKFTNSKNPKINPINRDYYSNIGKGEEWLYRTEKEGSGKRYYIRYYYERCKYSLYVDENDIIRSWRDEGGRDHMSKCLLR